MSFRKVHWPGAFEPYKLLTRRLHHNASSNGTILRCDAVRVGKHPDCLYIHSFHAYEIFHFCVLRCSSKLYRLYFVKHTKSYTVHATIKRACLEICTVNSCPTRKPLLGMTTPGILTTNRNIIASRVDKIRKNLFSFCMLYSLSLTWLDILGRIAARYRVCRMERSVLLLRIANVARVVTNVNCRCISYVQSFQVICICWFQLTNAYEIMKWVCGCI